MFYSLNDYRHLGSSYLPKNPKTLKEVIEVDSISDGFKGVLYPLVVDTEFVSHPNVPRKRLTIQVKHFGECYKNGVIFDDWDSCIDSSKRRHTYPTQDDIIKEMIVRNSGGADVKFYLVYDYDEYGEQTEFENIRYKHDLYAGGISIDEYKNLPYFVTVIYAHFATAELFTIGRERSALNSVLKKTLTGQFSTDHFNEIDSKRRLTTSRLSLKENHISAWIDTCQAVEVNGELYRMGLSIIDTASWGTYSNLLSSAKINLDSKELFSRGEGGEIERMDDMYLERAKDFDEYSLNDLRVDEALIKINEFHETDLLENGLEPSLRKLTDGSHVADRIKKTIHKSLPVMAKHIDFNVNRDKPFNGKKMFILGNSAYVSRIQDKEVSKLAKVIGGRCRNNRPLDIILNTEICDLDISGCYGDGMRAQLLPLGRPRTSSDKMTLGEFVKKFVPKFPYGGYVASVSGTLDFEQDLIQSWVKTDEIFLEDEEEVFDVEKGVSKIYSKEIINGFITSDILASIEAHGEKYKKKFFTQLTVNAWSGHFEEDRFYDEESLNEAFSNHFNGVDEISNEEIRQPDNTDFYGWIGQTLGEFIVDNFIATRKRAQIVKGKKSAEDLAAKLNVNTTYGVLASRFFAVGNVVAANNITGRARTFAWMMEKSYNSFHTITDGGGFELNAILYKKGERAFPVPETVSTLVWDKKKRPNFKKGGLTDEKIEIDYLENGDMNLIIGGERLSNKDSFNLINKLAFEHIANLFPNHPIIKTRSKSIHVNPTTLAVEYKDRIGLYEFEVKDCYTGAVLHGSSNYQWKRGDTWIKPKYRSYENNKRYTDATGNGMFDAVNPAEYFFNELKQNARRITIQPPFTKQGIIKVSDYKERYKTYDKLGLVVGDSKLVTGMFRPFSTSQFTFNYYSQYEKIDKIVMNDKNRLGWSYERFFLNEDGTLDYETMIKTVETMIRDGGTDITKYLPKMTQREIREIKNKKHPHFELLESLKGLYEQERE